MIDQTSGGQGEKEHEEPSDEWSIRQVLESVPYRWFVLAYFLDELCNAVWLVTLGLVISRTNTYWEAGLILVVTGVPLAMVLVFLSGWIDRKRSRNVALVTLACRTALMCVWAAVVVLDLAPFVIVAIIGGCVGAVSGLHEPAMTTYPTTVLPDDGAQAPAMVVERGGQRLSQAMGGVFAGWLVGWGDLGTPALFGAVTVLLALAILRRLNQQLPDPQTSAGTATGADNKPEPPGTSISGGFHFIKAHGVLARTLSVQAAISVTMAAVLMVTLPFRSHAEHWATSDYGQVFTVYGIGMTIATVSGWYLQRLNARSRILVSCALATVLGLVVIGVGLSSGLAATTILMGILGLCLGPAGPFLSGYLRGEAAAADKQAGTDQHTISGRANAMLILATDALEPVGYLFGVLLAIALPLSVATIILGVACTLVSGTSLLKLRRSAALRARPVRA